MAEETKEKEATGPFIADRHLYLNADKTKVVEEGDPAARFVLAGPGSIVPDEDVEKYGLKLERSTEQSGPAPDDGTVAISGSGTGVPPSAVPEGIAVSGTTPEGEGEVNYAATDIGEATNGEELKGKLPDDFPAVAALRDAGITSYGKLRRVKDLTEIPHIGDTHAAEIKKALGQSEQEEEEK